MPIYICVGPFRFHLSYTILFLCFLLSFYTAWTALVYTQLRKKKKKVQLTVYGSSIWGSYQTIWSPPLPNVTWHSGAWPCTLTPSFVKKLHYLMTVLSNWTLLPILTWFQNSRGLHGTFATVAAVLLRASGHVPFGTCVLMLIQVHPELVMFPYFEDPLVLLFCLPEATKWQGWIYCTVHAHWRNNPNVHMFNFIVLYHLIMTISLKINVAYLYFKDLVSVNAGGAEVHEGTCSQEQDKSTDIKFNSRFRLIRSVLRAFKFSVFYIDWNCYFVGLLYLLHYPFWLQLI